MYFDYEEQIENKFNKLDEIMRFINGGGMLIAADSNSRSKTWHDVITNSRGRKLEEYLASKQLHIINEESERTTFHNSRGSSNIDLTITNNNLLSDVNGWEISSEESLSDHNYLKYKIGAGVTNGRKSDYKSQSIRYVVKENRLHVYDRKLMQEMRKMADNKIKGGEDEELDEFIATIITLEEDLEQNVELFTEAVQSACRRTFQNSTTQKNSKKKSVPWWTDNLTLLRKRVNACRRLYQRTKNDEVLREKRKGKYAEERRMYQAIIKKEKLNSWKEYCNVEASINPWSQVYKLAAGKTRANSIMTTLRKPDGSETTSIQETMNALLDYLYTEDREEETLYHKTLRKNLEELINTSDDEEFSREEIKQTIDSFNHKKAPGIDGITGRIYQRTFTIFPRVITAIYNQCLKRGCFPKSWKTAKIIPTIKPGKENSKDPSKYRPISLLNMGGKVLEKLLINRINHHLYKHDLLTDKQFGFTPQKSTTDAAMEAKQFIEPVLEKRGLVIMTSLDVKGAFDAAWWPGILQGLKDLRCPRNLYNLSKGYFSDRTAVMNSNSITIGRRVTKGCPQGSCCGPGYWNILYNSMLSLELTSHSKAIAFADDLIILTRGETVVEAENYMNLEMRKIQDWAQNNKLKFNENKSKVMLMSRRKRREKKDIEIYVNNKKLQQVTSIKYLGIIFDSKMTFRDHINYVEEKCTKLIFTLAKSAKITWGLKHKALKTIYTGGILPLILYGAPVWKSVMNKACYKAKIIRIQRLINIRIAKAYRTVSNEALCVITGLMPINIKIAETDKFYEITKRKGSQYDREMEVKYWTHPAKFVNIIEGPEERTHSIQAYTDGSKNDAGVGSGIAIFLDNSLLTCLKYRLNDRCSNNQAEQMAILKALDYIQYMKVGEKTVLVYTDSRITLQLLKNQKKHTKLIDQIRGKVTEMEQQEWKVDFSWIKAHAGHRGNELADHLAKEAARNKNIDESYNRFPKSEVMGELNKQSVIQWQREWDSTTKGAITKSFFPKIVDRMKLTINATPNFTAIVTGHGNIKSYLHKYKIIQSPMCPCDQGEQSVEHILYKCKHHEQDRDRLKAAVIRADGWPVRKDILGIKYYKYLKEFTDNIQLNNE